MLCCYEAIKSSTENKIHIGWKVSEMERIKGMKRWSDKSSTGKWQQKVLKPKNWAFFIPFSYFIAISNASSCMPGYAEYFVVEWEKIEFFI